jgi:hypothetical protein
VGCIFAELMDGKPLFAGVCEIDQLFQIFSKLGTPSADVWPRYDTLPNFQATLFPNWEVSQLKVVLKTISPTALALLSKFLVYDPDVRLSAKGALLHEYFASDESEAVGGAMEMTPIASPPVTNRKTSFGHSVFAKRIQMPIFSAQNTREVNFSVSSFEGVGPVPISPIVLRQYMYLRHLEEDDVYRRPYFGCRGEDRAEDTARSSLGGRGGDRDRDRDSLGGRCSSSGSGGGRQLSGACELAGGEVTSGDVDVTCRQRMELVDSLIDIMDSISVHMCTRTVFFAVAIFDRYLALCEKLRASLFLEYELIGSTCLHIASKCEDVSYISVKDLARAARNISDGSAILKMEEVILNRLNFDLYIPAVIDFVGFFVKCVPEIEEESKVAVYTKYLSEISLMYPSFLTHPASLVGTAIVAYSLICCGEHPWPLSLRKLSMYEMSSAITVVKMLNRMHSRILEENLHGIFERYSSGITPFDVALLDPPRLDGEVSLETMFGSP